MNTVVDAETGAPTPLRGLGGAVLVRTARIGPGGGSGPKAGSITGIGPTAAFESAGDVNLSLTGAFAATVRLERSFDAGAAWEAVTYIDGTPLTWTVPISTTLTEPEANVLYRFNCTAFTSGPIGWRLG